MSIDNDRVLYLTGNLLFKIKSNKKDESQYKALMTDTLVTFKELHKMSIDNNQIKHLITSVIVGVQRAPKCTICILNGVEYCLEKIEKLL